MVSLKYIKKKENRDQNQNLNKTKENCDTNVAAEEKYNNKLSNSMMGLSREKYRTERKLKRLKENKLWAGQEFFLQIGKKLKQLKEHVNVL